MEKIQYTNELDRDSIINNKISAEKYLIADEISESGNFLYFSEYPILTLEGISKKIFEIENKLKERV